MLTQREIDWLQAWFRYLSGMLKAIADVVLTGGMTAADAAQVRDQLRRITESLEAASQPHPSPDHGETPMAQQPQRAIPPDLQAAIDGLKAAAAGAATKITDLKSQISTGMSQSDVDDVKSQIDTIATGLKSVSA